MKKKLFIDQEKCDNCSLAECKVACSYFYHPGNVGITSLRELAKYAIVCRKCEQGTCVQACPQDALEKTEDGVLKRYNMLCINCQSCRIACPFGTILPELLPYLLDQCDYCIGRCSDHNPPECVAGCPSGALQFREVAEDVENNIYKVNDNLYVHSIQWERV